MHNASKVQLNFIIDDILSITYAMIFLRIKSKYQFFFSKNWNKLSKNRLFLIGKIVKKVGAPIAGNPVLEAQI